MKSERKLKVIAVVGPTASGKSNLAVKLAKKFNGEIISADSRQVYKGLDIGTGKVPISKSDGKLFYKGIRHHLLDIASPKKQFTVADFQKLARRAIKNITKRGKVPILCGGTGLYVDATLYDFPIPSVKPDKALRKKYEALSAEKLFVTLRKKDPRRAKTIDRHNKRRLIRALEIVKNTRKPIPPLANYYKHPRYETLKIGILVPHEKLKEKIRKRLILRFRHGMIRETRELLTKKQITKKRLEELGLEYRYIEKYFSGQIRKRQMIEQLEKEIWRYAKRQMTWFRKDSKTIWIKNEREAEKAAANAIHNIAEDSLAGREQ